MCFSRGKRREEHEPDKLPQSTPDPQREPDATTDFATQRIVFMASPAQKSALADLAAFLGVSASQFIREALMEKFARHEKESGTHWPHLSPDAERHGRRTPNGAERRNHDT